MGEVRIIGGQWRGRKLTVLNQPGLRPTPDRIRETLFNWLNDEIVGSRCLDLFAGSGALGMEAASRGANSVLLVDQVPEIVSILDKQLVKFSSQNVKVICADARRFLCKSPTFPFDIIFLDPPFKENLLTLTCQLLEQYQWLNSSAYIYVEMERYSDPPKIPPTWQVVRQQTAGQIAYFLYSYQSDSSP